MAIAPFKNPFRPGAGHMPPYLAGRDAERREFERLLDQDVILENLVLTGLRGVGKTVLLDTFKPTAIAAGWLWVGTDLSESTSVSEDQLALRLLTDLAVVTSQVVISIEELPKFGLTRELNQVTRTLDFQTLHALYTATPGLVADKLRQVLEVSWDCLRGIGKRGLIFAYDEAQNLADHAARHQYPLSLLLDVFQSVQRKSIPFMLALTGLPTLFPKLVDARTFAERMFRVVTLERLSAPDSRKAVTKPVEDEQCPVRFSEPVIDQVVTMSGGYPYFIQFVCREAYDVIIQQVSASDADQLGRLFVPIDDILRKLDTDFFAGRWARATDRQRDLLTVIASVCSTGDEFSVQEVVDSAKRMLSNPFGASHVNQMLADLGKAGLIYRNRHGRYCFAVPLFGEFIKRQADRG